MNSNELFANLRNALASLYPEEASARRMAADAGLDERRIAFAGQAINTWHAIVQEAVKLDRLDALLQIALHDYSTNGALQAACVAWRAHCPAPRAQELAYLAQLLADYHYWVEKYTPLAGIAEVRAATTAGPRLDRPLLFMPTGFEQLIEHGFGEARRTERVAVADLRQAVARYRRLVLLGEPGSGKTTTLWRLVHEYAQAAQGDASAPWPLLVPLGGYTGPEPLLDYCQTRGGALAPHLLAYLRQGRLLLLLDGLNEMPRRDYAERVARVQQLLDDYPDLSVVVTCRALDYVETLALEKLEVKALDPARQLAYLQRYLGAAEGETLFWQLAGNDVAELWQTWQAAGGDWTAFWTAEKMPDAVYQKTFRAQDALWARLRQAELPPLLALGRNPYMLVMLAQVYAAERRLPQNRGRLFAAFVATLLAREEKRCDPAHWPGAEAVRQALAQLAYAMQQAGERGTALDESWATAQITVAGCRAVDLLYLATSATLLEWRDGTVRFVHQLVQEYFAAVALYNAWQTGADLHTYWPQDWSTPSGWEETFVLLAGLVPAMDELMTTLAPVNPALAARAIATSGGPPPTSATQAQVQQTLAKLATGRRTPLAQRSAAGDALNHLGDPRPGVGLTGDGLPDLLWCPVAAGAFLMGNTKATDEMAYADESPQHRLYLPAFAISQYPITNAQYAAFVHDGGYRAPWQHGWTVAGWQWRVEQRLDGPQRYGNPSDLPNHPVVGVSWYEATAFCAWLSHKLGRTVRLPSEAEWEKAARASLTSAEATRRYPWGDKVTREHANYAETGINSTSAVGIFPKGVSPSGALDMAGNVWEWTSSLWGQNWEKPDFGYPYDPKDGREDLAAVGRRVVRGGSFAYNQLFVRAACRNHDSRDSRGSDVGFRVVVPGS